VKGVIFVQFWAFCETGKAVNKQDAKCQGNIFDETVTVSQDALSRFLKVF
jgi:hypothetical protein